MRLKTQPAFLFILLTALCLIINTPASLAFVGAQEEKAINGDKATQDPSKTAKSSENNAATNNSEPTESDKDNHQHQVVINPPVNAFTQQQQDIEHYLTEEQVSPILVGSDKYLIAINKHTTPVNKGVMVLIPDWQQSIATPNALNQLRTDIPKYGWTTITLHPPHKPENYPSQALLAKERETENSEKIALYSKKMADIMLAVIEQAKNYPGVIIIVAEGSHAALMLDVYQQNLLAMPSALVMLSSYMPTIAENNKIAQQLALTDYPILDLYLKRDNRLVLANAKLRKDSAKREMKASYRQKQLNNRVTGYYPKKTLAKEIISWLSSLGW